MSLELKRVKVELIKVQAARAELELKIEEFNDNIHRLENHIIVQKNKEEELNKKINEMEKGK